MLVQRILVLSLLVLLTGVNVSLAQAISPSEQEELHHRTQQEAEERRSREQSKDTFLQKKEKPIEDIALPIEENSFYITTLQLEGDKSREFPWVQEMMNQYAGKKIGVEGVNLIVKRITQTLIARGYVTTRISIPEQNLSNGTLTLTLIPGIISDIRFASPDTSGNWHTAFPTRPGDILNLRDLEQGLEQIKRVPSQTADMKIAPGKKTGESDIIITIQSSNPFNMSIGLDDSGNSGTGKLQSSATVSIDNPFGINDLFYLSVNKNAEQRDDLYGTQGSSLQYSFPYGYWTFTVAGSSYKYHQTVQGRNVSFVSSGHSESLEFRMQRLIHRDQVSKTSLQFRVIRKHSQSFIDDTELRPQRKNVTADELSLSHRQYFVKTIVDLEIGHRWGVPWFHAQSEPANSQPGAQTTRYKLWTLDASLVTPVKIGTTEGRYSCNFRAQSTRDLIYGADYFSIGNRYTVRGFDGEQTLSAENGWFVRNELSIPIAKEREVYIGLDYGEVSGPNTEWLAGNKLAGGAIGIRGGNNTFQYDLFTSWPIYKPKEYSASSYCMGFQLTYKM